MGRGKHVNDFTVETNSQCFICSEKVLYGFASVKLEGTESIGSSIHSLQYLSRYLKLDMRKVFHEEGSIPQNLLDQLENSRLKVELCEDCGRMNETFSRQYKQLEKIEMEVKVSLELINRKFQEAMETNKTAQFKTFGTEANNFNGKMEIANALRSEAIGKCKLKFGNPSPLARIQRMSIKEVIAKQADTELSSQNSFRKPNHSLEENSAVVKEEILVVRPNQSKLNESDDSDDYQPHPYTSDVDFENADIEARGLQYPTASTSRVKKDEDFTRTWDRGFAGGTRILPSTSQLVEGKKYTINPETGKLKCNLCSMEFKKSVGFGYHYRSIHLGIKYKCKLCEKKFSHRSAYNRHHKIAHVKERRPRFT